MEKFVEILRDIIKSHSKMCLIFGVLFVLLGVTGGITYNSWLPISDQWGQITLAVIGLILIAISFTDSKSSCLLTQRNIQKLGIKITYPHSNERVYGKIRVVVTSKEAIPEGFQLHILRGYPSGGIVPNTKASQEGDKLKWTTYDFDIGGASNETRTIEAWLVGPAGTALLSNWEANHKILAAANRTLKDLGANKITWFPPITALTPDMHHCCSVVVSRAERDSNS
ncbi:hypothetical protein [Pseudoduganella namucuonensis]|uniref:Uncharacterized protein n=1 Tax=Pseudoduganella namucuonensis TaxID=1035707 RepID=A0A1I7I3N6_9BURK|nr:hypothetical protein [Pseudoduganella namucuonensis]SFU67580.1 hypothetical protein SAMN05216552_100771 [Pseudoduganella namucuonensis]